MDRSEARRLGPIRIILIAGLVGMLSSITGAAQGRQNNAQNALVGTWTLISFESHADSGEITFPMGNLGATHYIAHATTNVRRAGWVFLASV